MVLIYVLRVIIEVGRIFSLYFLVGFVKDVLVMRINWGVFSFFRRFGIFSKKGKFDFEDFRWYFDEVSLRNIVLFDFYSYIISIFFAEFTILKFYGKLCNRDI